MVGTVSPSDNATEWHLIIGSDPWAVSDSASLIAVGWRDVRTGASHIPLLPEVFALLFSFRQIHVRVLIQYTLP